MDKHVHGRKLVVFIVILFVLVGMSIPFLLYDKTTLTTFRVGQTDIRIMYDRSNNPLLWLSGMGGVIWDADGPGRYGSGRLSGSTTYDLLEDVIVEINADHPGRFTITKWGSTQTPSEWIVHLSKDERVLIREYTIERASNP